MTRRWTNDGQRARRPGLDWGPWWGWALLALLVAVMQAGIGEHLAHA